MKFLIDQNISPHVSGAIDDLSPESLHVSVAGYDRASDRVIWNYALDNGFAILSKDADFIDLSLVLGHPPKVVWITPSNVRGRDIASALRRSWPDVTAFASDTSSGIFHLVVTP